MNIFFGFELIRAVIQVATNISGLRKCHPAEGTGIPIVLYPGAIANATALAYMTRKLRERGHNVHAWTEGSNFGPTPEVIAGLKCQLKTLKDTYGQAPIIVGQSLGGYIARLMGHEYPEYVSKIITVGTPSSLYGGPMESAMRFITFITPGKVDWKSVISIVEKPINIETVSIWSASDGVVSPWHSIGNDCRNIRVASSHLAMGFDPNVIEIIATECAI